MKPFYYINEKEEEEIDLIDLFEYAFDYKVNYKNLKKGLDIIKKHVNITEK